MQTPTLPKVAGGQHTSPWTTLTHDPNRPPRRGPTATWSSSCPRSLGNNPTSPLCFAHLLYTSLRKRRTGQQRTQDPSRSLASTLLLVQTKTSGSSSRPRLLSHPTPPPESIPTIQPLTSPPRHRPPPSPCLPPGSPWSLPTERPPLPTCPSPACAQQQRAKPGRVTPAHPSCHSGSKPVSLSPHRLSRTCCHPTCYFPSSLLPFSLRLTHSPHWPPCWFSSQTRSPLSLG